MDHDALSTYATRAAITACARRLSVLGWSPDAIAAEAVSAALADTLRDCVAEALPAAVADYRDAAALGMEDVARATFTASLAVAGIRAADRHHTARPMEDRIRAAFTGAPDPQLASWEPTLAGLE